ncbi:ArsA-related P-loop ATPase [Salinibacterium sp. TMP30]|uniref:ArsA-related P-loop ATPase n=1 Tax=Salinibacterium sp. TMP30 TaxID=3138237 RepID=UPI003138F1D3
MRDRARDRCPRQASSAGKHRPRIQYRSCTTEIASFDEFTNLLTDTSSYGRYDHIIFDTAPTGHTLLLLDATGSYHREIARQIGDILTFVTPLMRLQDPAQTKVILVTLAETTPVLEAEGLQQDLERAGIHPWGWVVNNSIAATHPVSPFLRKRAANEVEQIAGVRALSPRIALVPLLAEEPIGEVKLSRLTQRAHQPV